MRRVFQIGLVLVIFYAIFFGGDVEKFCPAGGMASLTGQLVNGRMSCQMSAINIFMFFAVVASVIIAGRLFCSFLCPLGTIGEGLAVPGKKLGLNKVLPKWADIPLRAVKFILLFFVLKETFRSSELFCKTFDPYFAMAGRFAHETVPWAGITTIIVLILGGIAGKLFWCKYACFFAAAQNTLSTIFGAVIGALYIGGCKAAGKEISFETFFFLLCIFGYAGELYGQRFLPIVKVKKGESCTNCKACDKACPHGIEVSSFDKVTHADCHLCGACVNRCPVNGALSYSPFGGKWLAPALVIIFSLMAYAATSQYGATADFATIRFVPDGLKVDGKTVAVYGQKGVRSIHCWGSSMSFAYRLGKRKGKTIEFFDGIYGLETYAATKEFMVYYDPRKLKEKDVQGMIFKAGKVLLTAVTTIDKTTVPEITVWKAGIFGVVDDWDIVAVKKKLLKSPHVFAFTTVFGEPIKSTIYYDGSKINTDELKKLLEDEAPLKFGKENLTFHFNVDGKGQAAPTLSRDDFVKTFFPKRRQVIAKLDDPDDEVATYAITGKGLDVPKNGGAFKRLSWHLAPLDGLLEISTALRDMKPVLLIKAIADEVELDDVKAKLMAKEIVYTRREKENRVPNPFVFTGELQKIPGK